MKTQFIERENGWCIRIQSQFGFRWFETTSKKARILKAMEAKKIEQSIIDGDKKYSFICPIVI